MPIVYVLALYGIRTFTATNLCMMKDFNNPVLKKLPQRLRRYLVGQHYEHYTPIDQAVWRYVMRQNYSYLKDVAYYPYIPGLRKAGLSIERIPDLQTMNDHLKDRKSTRLNSSH